jgi:hypothetical protein
MRRMESWFMVVVLVVSAMVGGALSSWLFLPEVASAQGEHLQIPDNVPSLKELLDKFQSRPQKLVVAQEFHLVDSAGNLRGRLFVDEKGHGQLELLPVARTVE